MDLACGEVYHAGFTTQDEVGMNAATATVAKATLPATKATILIVDDEPDVLEVLEEYFTTHGYEAVTAADVRRRTLFTRATSSRGSKGFGT